MIKLSKSILLSYLAIVINLALANFIIIPVVLQTVVYTIACINIGAHWSYGIFKKDEDTGECKIEGISTGQAALFPVLGSGVLFSLYIAYKFFSRDVINLLLGIYLTIAGVFAITETLRPLVRSVIPWKKQYRVTIFREKIELDVAFFISLVFATVVGYIFIYHDNFTAHNCLALGLAIQGIAVVSLGQFRVGYLLLWLLFVYDIFWVFGTDVMVFVATNMRAPMKIVFPKSFQPFESAILGLGDLCIPGFFLGLCLRFDMYKVDPKKSPSDKCELTFSQKHYFLTTLLGYIFGILLAQSIMYLFDTAQPALLYLVPGVTLAHLVLATYRRELSLTFSYDESKWGNSKDEKTD